MAESKQLNIGRAGEHLVMADLLGGGYRCFMSDQGMNYDIVIDIETRFVRLQVKTTSIPRHMNNQYRTPTYLFHAKRAGRLGKRSYSKKEFDGFALVALDIKQIAYILFTEEITRTIILRDRRENYKQNSGAIAPYIDDFPLQKFMTNFSTN